MKNYLLFSLLFLTNSKLLNAQNLTVSFSETVRTVSRDKVNDRILQFTLKSPVISTSTYTYSINIQPDLTATTLVQSQYRVDFRQQVTSNVNPLGETVFYVILKPDSIPDREREIKLKVKIMDSSSDISVQNSDQQGLTIKIKSIETPKKDTIRDYSYLAYVGTNFDLVDGLKAKNLFFATNFFLPNKTKKFGIGAYISLYGNRTITSTDSLSNVTRTARIARASDTTAIYYNERANRISSYYSDNIGAYFSPLINLGKLSREGNNLRVYFAPSAEFIWRRTNVKTSYSGKTPTDTIIKNEQVIGEIIPPDKFNTSFNQYQFNVGYLGMFLTHESRYISIRLYFAVGNNFKYIPAVTASSTALYDVPYRKQEDMFFSGRLWVTEPISGVTLQAEITNTSKYPTPYYGVTLSKAIDFRHIGNIFSPISSR